MGNNQNEAILRWALAIATPAIGPDSEFVYPVFSLGNWRSRRAMTAEMACMWAKKGMDQLTARGFVHASPLARFDPEAWDETIQGQSASDAYGILKMGSARVSFWPVSERVMPWDDSESFSPRPTAPTFGSHWRLRSASILFGGLAMRMAAKRYATELISQWLSSELALPHGVSDTAFRLRAAWEAGEMSKSVAAPGKKMVRAQRL